MYWIYLPPRWALPRTVLLGVAILLACLCTAGCSGSNNTGTVYTVLMTPADVFSPVELHVTRGSIVRFVNTDSDAHAPVTDPGNDAGMGPNSDPSYPSGVPAGGSYSWAVPAGAVSGTEWYYHCRFHGTAGDGDTLGTGMAGEIVVD